MTDKIKDNKELQEKIDCYSDMLFRIAYLRLKNRQDAEDVVQDAFYQYIKKQEVFDNAEHEKAWLIKVTLNGCRRVWRSAWNRHRSSPDDVEGEYKQAHFSCEGIEESVMSMENNRILLEAVESLPVKYRDVIHLFYYEELSIREIGEVTGRRESTVTSQLTRGRELLRKRLKEEYDFA